VLIPTSAPIAAKEQQSMINRMRNHTDKEISREKDKKEKIEPRSNNKTIEKEEMIMTESDNNPTLVGIILFFLFPIFYPT